MYRYLTMIFELIIQPLFENRSADQLSFDDDISLVRKRILILSSLKVFTLIVVLLKNTFTAIVKSKTNINANPAKTLLQLRKPLKMISTVLTAKENQLYIMTAMATLFMFV